MAFLQDLKTSLAADEKAFFNWLAGAGGVLAVSGAIYAGQLEPVSHTLANVVRVAAVICAFALAAHQRQT